MLFSFRNKLSSQAVERRTQEEQRNKDREYYFLVLHSVVTMVALTQKHACERANPLLIWQESKLMREKQTFYQCLANIHLPSALKGLGIVVRLFSCWIAFFSRRG